MPNISLAHDFYSQPSWKERDWIRIIAVEYQTLVDSFPFVDRLRALEQTGSIRVLDVGCGTAIFPRFLDTVLPDDLHMVINLLDSSAESLRAARSNLSNLAHFSPGETYKLRIENIPTNLGVEPGSYEVIWAMHSFTTVEIDRMRRVLSYLMDLLRPRGIMMIYQLTGQSSYQSIHRYLRETHPDGASVPRYMQFEDTIHDLESLGLEYQVLPLSFSHEVPDNDRGLLAAYLQKCVLDPDLDALEFFAPILPEFHEAEQSRYRFPQQVNLLTVEKT